MLGLRCINVMQMLCVCWEHVYEGFNVGSVSSRHRLHSIHSTLDILFTCIMGDQCPEQKNAEAPLTYRYKMKVSRINCHSVDLIENIQESPSA